MNARRRFFAEEVLAVAGIDSPALLEAFAQVPREQFLGAGPWQILYFGDGGKPEYRGTPDADPAHLFHNVAVAIDPSRMLNNGQPSSLALWLHTLFAGKWRDVHRLRRDPHDQGPSCILHLAHCCLCGR
jgi:protein-L-isoaspartate(D-aspartate) O-methyltransferase